MKKIIIVSMIVMMVLSLMVACKSNLDSTAAQEPEQEQEQEQIRYTAEVLLPDGTIVEKDVFVFETGSKHDDVIVVMRDGTKYPMDSITITEVKPNK
jgi:flagellar basal body-associated protein FliL